MPSLHPAPGSFALALALTLAVAPGCGSTSDDDTGAAADASLSPDAGTSPDATVPAADARPRPDAEPPPAIHQCDELPLELPPGVPGCVTLLAGGGCVIVEGEPGATSCTSRIGVFPAGVVRTRNRVDATATSHGVYEPSLVAVGEDVVSGVPRDVDVTVDLRNGPRDRRALTARFNSNDSVTIVSMDPLPGLEDCPDAAALPVPYFCTRFNAPTWEAVDWQIYPGHTDLIASNMLALMPNHKVYLANGVIGPDVPHARPHDGELTAGMAAVGREQRTAFTVAEWTDPQILNVTGLVVASADGPIGVTPDEPAAPYIDFPEPGMRVDGDMYRNGALVDGEFDSTYPRMNALSPAVAGDGYSHFPLSFGEGTEFIPGTPGSYELSVRIYDADYNGWEVVIPFTVTE